MSVWAVIPAGGSGRRLGLATPKQFLTLQGFPLLVHTLRAFERARLVDHVALVLPRDRLSEWNAEHLRRYELHKVTKVVSGGERRQDSVQKGLEALPADCTRVAIHDGARALITPDLIDQVIEACERWDGAIAALPVRDTLKMVEEDRILSTQPRENLWAMQTPQVFQFPMIREAYWKAQETGMDATDDAAVAEILGARLRVVEGNVQNFKITLPSDIPLAESILKAGG